MIRGFWRSWAGAIRSSPGALLSNTVGVPRSPLEVACPFLSLLNPRRPRYEELGFVETPEEAEEDYKLLHEELADKTEEGAEEDLAAEKTKAK